MRVRPLASDAGQFATLYQTRRDAYGLADVRVAIETDDLAALRKTQWDALSTGQIEALSTDQIASLRRASLTLLSTTAVAALTVAAKKLETKDFKAAIGEIENGLQSLRDFYSEYSRSEMADQSPEVFSL